MTRVLHVLSQRPAQTGSGITLDAAVRHAAEAGWDQHVVVGTPAEDPGPPVGDLPRDRVHPLVFGRGGVAFPLPGMSDVMPYPSTVFSRMNADELVAYRAAWRRHVGEIVDRVRPDLIHVHHVWILGAMMKDLAPDLPIVNQCHSTGLRQMALCPHLADEVRAGCKRNDRFVTQHGGVRRELTEALRIGPDRVLVVGAGYREEIFNPTGRPEDPGPSLIYVGKYAAAKGLPWLLDAVERVREAVPDVRLHVAGSGAGPEAEALRERMASYPFVEMHGQLAQPALADLMRRSVICVLPSFYEGVPLVLVEARASGCRLVCTRLPGIEEQLAPHLGDDLELVSLPHLRGIDQPEPADLPAFVERLASAITRNLGRPPPAAADLAPFTWGAVFRRIETVWREVVRAPLRA